jgi:group I intron endonuclease
VRGVYRITNIVNGKSYIGSSVDVEKRFSEHKRTLKNGYHRNIYLQRAWWKYGEDAFKFEMLEEVLKEEFLLTREQAWIDGLKCYQSENGYNICKVAGRTTGYKHTEESRRIISEMAKKRYESPDFHLKKYQYKKGNKLSEETIEKMRNAQRPTGEDSSRAKLTNRDVEIIVDLILNGHNDTRIASKFSVTRKTISSIRNRKSFTSVTERICPGNGPIREACQFTFIGSESPRSKLNEEKVAEIKQLFNQEISIAEIARRYNVSWNLIKQIKKGLIWTHVNIGDVGLSEEEE